MAFLLKLASSLLLAGAIFSEPVLRDSVLNGKFAFLSKKETAPAPAAPSLTSEIANQRRKVEELQGAFASISQDLPTQYQQLEKRRATLKPNDQAAVAKFNADATAYQAKTKQQKQIQQDLTIAQSVLDQLLDARSRASAPGASASGGKQVVIYTTSHCPACKVAKDYMAQKGIHYQEIDVETSKEGNAAYQKLGGHGTPLIMVGDKKMQGFNSQEFDRLLM